MLMLRCHCYDAIRYAAAFDITPYAAACDDASMPIITLLRADLRFTRAAYDVAADALRYFRALIHDCRAPCAAPLRYKMLPRLPRHCY